MCVCVCVCVCVCRQEVTVQTAGQMNALQEKIARLKTFLRIATSRITDKNIAAPANLEGVCVCTCTCMSARACAFFANLNFPRFVDARAPYIACRLAARV